MDKIEENHAAFLQRKALDKSHGYDIDAERVLIIEKARPFVGRILEAGTVKGYLTLALSREGYSLTTFDISENELEIAKLNLSYACL